MFLSALRIKKIISIATNLLLELRCVKVDSCVAEHHVLTFIVLIDKVVSLVELETFIENTLIFISGPMTEDNKRTVLVESFLGSDDIGKWSESSACGNINLPVKTLVVFFHK